MRSLGSGSLEGGRHPPLSAVYLASSSSQWEGRSIEAPRVRSLLRSSAQAEGGSSSR